jgi:hypothetical protein
MTQTINIPKMRIVSESNAHEHWLKKARRAKDQRGVTKLFLLAEARKPPIPCVIRLTRIAPRKLDQGNIAAAFKHVQDGCADWIGIDDRHEDLVKYEYKQEKGAPKTCAVRIEIVEGIK